MRFQSYFILMIFCIVGWSCFQERDDNKIMEPGVDVLSKPIPIFPTPGSSDQKLSVLLEWKPAQRKDGGPVFYEVRVNGQPGNNIWGRDIVETNMWVHNLKPNTSYTWSVVADDHNGNRAFSTKNTFTTGDYQPPEMDIIYEFSIDSDLGVMQYAVKKGSHPITGLGVCWSTSGIPTIEDNVLPFTVGNGSGVATITFMKDSLYFIKSYIESESGITYGKLKKFPSIQDAEKNEYHIVTIENQTWMAENLRTTLGRDGNKLATLQRSGDSLFVEKYGLVYSLSSATNRDSMEGTQGVCPEGWHLPSKHDFIELFSNLGGADVAGGKMKNGEIRHWLQPNTGAEPMSRINALPTGYWARSFSLEPNWTSLYRRTDFWTSSLDTVSNFIRPIHFSLHHDNASVLEEKGISFLGVNDNYFCVRCLKN